MAIYNLSGNFPPISGSGGNALPLSKTSSPLTQAADSIGVTQVQPAKPDKLSAAVQTTPPEKQDKLQQNNAEIEQLQLFNQQINRSLQFKVDDELGVTIVRVIDRDTNELIRQFPPDELINLSRRLKSLNEEGQPPQGVLLQEKV